MQMKPEIWKDIKNEEVKPYYMISNYGRVYNKVTDTYLKHHNPKHEKNYCRVTLMLKSGKGRKFSVQQLVCHHFKVYRHLDKPDVNHIDGNKQNNYIGNLEWTNDAENKRHAAENELYKNGEDSHKSTFTNEEVHKICKLFEKGYNVARVIEAMNMTDREYIFVYITRILYRETWKSVSKNYTWNAEDIRYKTYKKSDIEEFCRLISLGVKNKDIAEQFDYDKDKLKKVLKKIRQGKLYRKISSKYINL